LENGQEYWAFGYIQYAGAAVDNVEEYLKRRQLKIEWPYS